MLPLRLTVLLVLSVLSAVSALPARPIRHANHSCPFLHVRGFPAHTGLNSVYRATSARCLDDPVWIESARAYATGANDGKRRRLRALHVTTGAASLVKELVMTVIADTPVRCGIDPFSAHAAAWGRVTHLSRLNGTLFTYSPRRVDRPQATRAKVSVVCARDDVVRLPRRDVQ